MTQGLPPTLLPYLRLAHATSAAEVSTPGLLDPATSRPLSPSNESEALHQLAGYLQLRLGRWARCLLGFQGLMFIWRRRWAYGLPG